MRDSKLKRFLVSQYEIFYEFRRITHLRLNYHLNIMSPVKTLRYIQRNKCCIARYGDGEFDLIFSSRHLHFQNMSENIEFRLKEVLSDPPPNLLLCIPRCMNTTRNCNDHSGTFWIEWGKHGHHEEIVTMIRRLTGSNYRFGDSQITRPYIDWKTDRRARKTFPMLKSLWAGRDILIVEGDQTRLGVGNDLFAGVSSVKRILAPAVNAFDHYDAIRQAVLEHYHGELILLALGPTATILAWDLAKQNIQALDIGNIDIEYEWFLRRAAERIPIPGKFTNEASDGRTFTECSDPQYLSQIIHRIGI